MDLLFKVIIIAVLLIIIVFGIFSFFGKAPVQNTLTRSDAINIIRADILNKTPNAQINLISANSSSNDSWNVSFTVVYNGSRACPTLLEEDFDYPAFGLTANKTIYTDNCKVYGYANVPYYIISMPQIAIAESYNENAIAESYVNTFGYGNTNIYATKYTNLTSNNLLSLGINQDITSNIISGNSVLTNMWIVNYSASNSDYKLYLLMHQSGNIIADFLLNKTK